MREIKFRAWNKHDKYFERMDMSWIFINGVIAHRFWDNSPLEKHYDLQQYTGLKDKNGVEIYEGDIVNFQHIDDYGYMTNVFQNGFYRGVVKWGEHYPAFDIFDIKDNSTFGFDCNIFSMESDIVIEVIGNTYENKELSNTDG